MPNKLTDTEIKKALEEHYKQVDKGYSTHLEYGGKGDEHEEKYIYMLRDVLDLINRYEEENKKWQVGYMTQKQEIANLEIELQAMRNAANGFKAEVERLQKALENQQKISMDRRFEVKELKSAINGFRGYEDKIKAEAYKEFAGLAVERVEKAKLKYQRLCKEQGEEMEEHMHIHFNGIIGIINNLLNELVGDKNAGEN